MLKKKYRLSWGVRFDSSRSFSSPFFIVKVRPNMLLFNRFGLIISKKIEKRAVYRNRIKRLIHSIVVEFYDNIKNGIDALFIIKKSAVGKTRKELYLAMKQMFSKEGLLK